MTDINLLEANDDSLLQIVEIGSVEIGGSVVDYDADTDEYNVADFDYAAEYGYDEEPAEEPEVIEPDSGDDWEAVDYIQGWILDDVINGGKGGDVLVGGDGADTFVFAAGDGSVDTGGDTVIDFVSGVDKITIEATDYQISYFNGITWVHYNNGQDAIQFASEATVTDSDITLI